MRESLRTFIFREAGNSGADRLSLLRDVAPHIYIERGYDVDELRELHSNDGGSEYVSASWPEVPVLAPLHCIAIRPYSPIGHQGSPYELVARVAGYLRDVLADAVLEPDYDDIIRHAYVQREHLEDWAKAAARWRQSHASDASQAVPDAQAAEGVSVALPKQPAQERRILELLKAQGHDPLALPKRNPGTRGAKAEVKAMALRENQLFSDKSFDKAWDRLRGHGDIADS